MAIETKRITRWGVMLGLAALALSAGGCGRKRARTPSTQYGNYDAPGGPGPTPVAYVQPTPAPTPVTAPPPDTSTVPESDRKPAARAAYTEGVRLQDDGKFAEALSRFETAQKFFDAPTHLLHMAECQVMLGRLVEASETYESLSRKTLPAGAPDAFVAAQRQGKAELGPLRARVPTLRITTKPDSSQLAGLQVNVNGVSMPPELVGIPRPLNPGLYRISATARGHATTTSIDVPLAEKEQKSVELVLVPGGKR